MPNYTDPNLDFGLEQELLVKALKESEAQRAARIQGGGLKDIGSGQVAYMAGSGPGGALDAALTRGLGNFTKPVVEQNMRDLSSEEARRYDELSRQMSEPGEVDYESPESLTAENARQMGIAQQMYKLPNARKVAQDYLVKGAGFPEAIAQMRMKQIEAGQQNAMRLREQEARQRELEEGRNQRAADANALRMTLAAMRQSGGGEAAVPSMQHKGFTPEGLPVSYNPKDGQIYVAGKPYTGDVVGGSDFSKGVVKRREAEGDIRRVDDIITKVESNKEAFGNIPALASSQWMPNAIGSRIINKNLTPEQRQARTAVAQEAAQAINQIYGAALSAGESARADQWAYKATDSFETTMTKMKQARAWAAANADKYGGGRKSEALATPAPSGGSEEWVRGPDGKLMRK